MADFSAMRGMLGVESQRGPLSPLGGPSGPSSVTRPEAPAGGATSVKEVGFADALEKAAGELEAAHGIADQRSLDLIMGRDVAVHDVMAAVAEAEIATQMTTAVAVKAIQAYQEIWRMEI
jgi:flagellar hook-basal body complex protein FliE